MLISRDIPFRFVSSLNMDSYHHAVSRNNNLGLQIETITKKDDFGFSKGEPKSFFFIDGIEKEFKSLDELCDFYNEKFQYEEDNPNQEVVFVKIIRQRKQ